MGGNKGKKTLLKNGPWLSAKFMKGINQVLLLILQDCHPNQLFQGLIIFLS